MSAKPRRKGSRWEVVFASDRVPSDRRRAMFDEYDPALAWATAVVQAVGAGLFPPAAHVFTDQETAVRRFPLSMMQRTPLVDAARIWHEFTYKLRGDANAERADAVWVNFCNHVLPFLSSVGVFFLQDIRAVHVEELEFALAGRTRSGVFADPVAHVAHDSRLLTVKELAELSSNDPMLRPVSVSMIYRSIGAGLLTPVTRGPEGMRLACSDAVRAGVLRGNGVAKGLNEASARDLLRTLREIMLYARGHGVSGVLTFSDKTWRSARVWGKDKARPRRRSDRDPSWVELYNVAAELPVVHQFTMWLLALTGVRMGEAFGFHVEDWVDADDTNWAYEQTVGVGGVLVLERQGGRQFTYVDDFTGEILSGDEKGPKTQQSLRVVVVPEPLAKLIRLVVRIFHTDPVTGWVDPQARLVPVLNSRTGAQGTFSSALQAARQRAGAPAFTPHTLRGRLVSDLTDLNVAEWVIKRMVGHRPGTDVLAIHYQRDTPELRQLRAAAALTAQLVDGQLPDGLMVPTVRRNLLRRGVVDGERWATIDALLQEEGWHTTEASRSGRFTVPQVAQLTGAARSTVRRGCANGTIRSDSQEAEGKVVHLIPADEVDRLVRRSAERVTLPLLAERLNIPYATLWQLSRSVAGIEKSGRDLIIGAEAATELTARAQAWLAIRARSMSVTEVALRLGCDRQVVGRLARSGVFEADPEDPSRFTAESIDAWITRRRSRTNLHDPQAS